MLLIIGTTRVFGTCVAPPRKEAYRMAKRKAAKRTLTDATRGGKRFVRRTARGTFKESDQVAKSLPADRRKKAKTKATRGQGDKGDR